MIQSAANNPQRFELTPTLLVEHDGRRFPRTWDRTPQEPAYRLGMQAEINEGLSLADKLAESVWKQLPWNLRPPEVDRQELVQTYIASLTQLDRFRQDVDNLLRLACRANLEFRQGLGETHVQSRDEAMGKKLDEMFSHAEYAWSPLRNVLNAKLVSLPGSALRETLNEALSEAVRDFSKQFIELLAKLVDAEMFGLVEWLPNQCCSYHFFKQVVIQDNEGASTRVENSYFSGAYRHRSRNERVGTRRKEVVKGKGQHHYRLARHQHEVMNAVRTSIANSRVVMPPPVKLLVENVPDWLDEHVKVIDGDLFRERIVERDAGCENWADIQVQDEPIYGTEPGVIIGPFVLTGWGPREVEAETTRREQEAEQELAAEAARALPPLVFIALVISSLALGTIMIGLAKGGIGLLVAVMVAMAAVTAIWQASFTYGKSVHLPSPDVFAHLNAGFWGSTMLILGWMGAILVSPTPLVIAVTAFGVGGTCLVQLHRLYPAALAAMLPFLRSV